MIEETLPIEPALKNRDTLTRWLVNIHNIVNKRLGKPIFDYDTVKNKYESLKCSIDVCSNLNAQCTKSQRKTNNLLYLITILLVIVIITTLCYIPYARHRSKIHIVR